MSKFSDFISRKLSEPGSVWEDEFTYRDWAKEDAVWNYSWLRDPSFDEEDDEGLYNYFKNYLVEAYPDEDKKYRLLAILEYPSEYLDYLLDDNHLGLKDAFEDIHTTTLLDLLLQWPDSVEIALASEEFSKVLEQTLTQLPNTVLQQLRLASSDKAKLIALLDSKIEKPKEVIFSDTATALTCPTAWPGQLNYADLESDDEVAVTTDPPEEGHCLALIHRLAQWVKESDSPALGLANFIKEQDARASLRAGSLRTHPSLQHQLQLVDARMCALMLDDRFNPSTTKSSPDKANDAVMIADMFKALDRDGFVEASTLNHSVAIIKPAPDKPDLYIIDPNNAKLIGPCTEQALTAKLSERSFYQFVSFNTLEKLNAATEYFDSDYPFLNPNSAYTICLKDSAKDTNFASRATALHDFELSESYTVGTSAL